MRLLRHALKQVRDGNSNQHGGALTDENVLVRAF